MWVARTVQLLLCVHVRVVVWQLLFPGMVVMGVMGIMGVMVDMCMIIIEANAGYTYYGVIGLLEILLRYGYHTKR